jgi:hypothetical protein
VKSDDARHTSVGGVDKRCRGGTRWRRSVTDRRAWNRRAVHGARGGSSPGRGDAKREKGWGPDVRWRRATGGGGASGS